MHKKRDSTCKVVVFLILTRRLRLNYKLPVVTIQKFCYHGNVTSQFCPTYFTLNQGKLEKTANISRQDLFP